MKDFRDLSLSQLARFFELSPDAIVGVLHGGELAFANEAARAMFRLSADLTGLALEDLLPTRLRERHVLVRGGYEQRPWRREMGALRDLVARRRDGSELFVEVSLAPLVTEGEVVTIAAVRDVSDRRHHEQRQRRLHAMLAEANETMLHARTPVELCRQLCEAIAWSGGFLLAWVGTAAGDLVLPAAAAGPAAHRLPGRLSLTERDSLSQAIRERQPVTHALPRPAEDAGEWAKQLWSTGVRSTCALPLTRGADTIGGLSLWSTEEDFFLEERLALLEQLAINVSLALDRLAAASLQDEVARLGQLALSDVELQDMLDECARSVATALSADACQLYERNEDGSSTLRATASVAESRGVLATGRLTRRPSAAAETTSGAADVAAAGRLERASVVRLPIEGHRGQHGELDLVRSKGGQLGPEERAYLASVVSIVGASMERARAEERLSRLALHDPLTGLPNRRRLLDHLSEATRRCAQDGRDLAVLFVDLDRFKLVNDALGHSCGDDLLVRVARRLAEAVDPSQLVARIGGDEFAVVCEDITAGGAATIAKQLADALTAPFSIACGSTFVTASIGIALAEPGASAEQLLREADAAMYQAKGKGRDRFAFFDDELRVRALTWLEIEADLRRALRCSELTAHYQPVHRLDGSLGGLEALVRWHHPERQVVHPDEFIKIAEDTGLIRELGVRILEVVCIQLAAWQHTPELSGLPVALNLSGVELADPGFPGVVEATLSRHHLEPSLLQVEVTETALMRDPLLAAKALASLNEVGVQVAIDDFGTGYSSLHYLRQFPVDAIKIDQSFIREIHHNKVDLAIVRSVTELARALQLTTIAEGVERIEQLEALRSCGCDMAQGHIWSPALGPAELEASIRKGPR